MPVTLVIGVGGVGAVTCRRLSERLAGTLAPGGSPADGELAAAPLPELLILDTDRAVAQNAGGVGSLLLTANTAMLDAAYRAPDRFHAEWINREVLRGRGALERGTGGSRMLGRFLLLLPDNAALVRDRVKKWLEANPGERCRVYLVAGAAGGTGGGQLVDVAYLVQETAAALRAEVELRGILFVPPPNDAGLAPNAFAALTELHYFSDPFTRYRAFLGDPEKPFVTRRPPFRRVSVLTSVTAEGETIPLTELQERTAVYLLTASVGDDGNWERERYEREARVRHLDADSNPQVFGTFGVEWVEYPEERLVNAVYRNLVRRSITPWLQGDQPLHLNELPNHVPLRDPEALARLLTEGAEGEPETILRPIRTRLPWIHKAPPSQWTVMDQEFQGLVDEIIGTPPAPGRPGKGPMADRFRALKEQALADLRDFAARSLKREHLALERVARVLNESATDLKTATDPIAPWEEAYETVRQAKDRILWIAAAARKDPFLMFFRGQARRRLAAEYEKIAAIYVRQTLRAKTLPYLPALRTSVLEPIRAWSGRISELAGLYARLSKAMADHEAGLLERLRKDDEEKRLVLGLMRLPGGETPYVANTGWNLPYCRPEEEAQAIQELRNGWTQRLVDREDGLLADPGRSILDGPSDQHREERLPWMMPSSFSPMLEGGSPRMREAVMHIDRELRAQSEDRLRAWLSATAFQRLAEQYRNPVDLEFQLRRLVNGPAELPALEPPHARPADFQPEYELVFFGETKAGELPSPLKMVVDAASREHPTRVVPSRSAHYLTAISEHPGFALSRCPAYLHLQEAFNSQLPAPGAQVPHPYTFPFSRMDVPWTSATLVTRGQMRDASDVLFLALAFALLRPLPEGEVPIPATLLPLEPGERRFPLPGEFDLAVRQLAGDTRALEAVGQAVDRAFQSRGVEWCGIQLEQAVRDFAPAPQRNPLGIRFPGADGVQQTRVLRLAAIRAACRYEDLVEEYARSPVSRETAWLRVGATHTCPSCGHDLGANTEALPGACPACRQPLFPHKLKDVALTDGFRRIPNPFVVGTPLETGAKVFVGREDIIQTVRDRLIRPAGRTILILIGERRCGKTSALKQLQHRLAGDLTPIFVDMQGLTASDLPGFLYWLAWRMKESLDERGIQVDLPTFEEFSSGPADYQFETVILPRIRQKINGGRVLLMLDEFEVLAQRVMNGTFDGRAFDYIRHLMQHGEGIEFLFAGTHVLHQFAANYVTFLFNIGVFLKVDFLRPEDAVRLITEPVAAAGVTFSKEALDSVLELAGAHAYFTQMFGFHLVERLNRLRKRHVTREDVEGESGPVIAAGGAHLDHLWGQLNGAERLLMAFFADMCPRGESRREDDVLHAAVKDDPTLRPFIFRSAVEKLIAVGLLRAGTEETPEGRQARTLSLTAEVYRQWLYSAHPYSRLKDEGVRWE